MAATSIRLSESFFKDLPIQLKVGKQGKIFHVHPGVFVPFTSSAIYARVYGSWKDRSEEVLDLTEFDEHTIVCFLSYVYARDYCPFPAAPDSNLEIEEQIKKFNLKTTGKESFNKGLLDGEGMFSVFLDPAHIAKTLRNLNPIETISDHPAIDGLNTRPLTPIEEFMIPEQPATIQSATNPLGLAGGHDELLAIEILTHAKVYCFAHGHPIDPVPEKLFVYRTEGMADPHAGGPEPPRTTTPGTTTTDALDNLNPTTAPRTRRQTRPSDGHTTAARSNSEIASARDTNGRVTTREIWRLIDSLKETIAYQTELIQSTKNELLEVKHDQHVLHTQNEKLHEEQNRGLQ
ncbi:hypothetical protein CBS147330_9925 [Penicillium roqueforti]|nr:hypothetical protein CBS147330_9925 [Penicillium roqueforti]